MDDDKYPHWKDALFGNHNAVANLRCAVHYVFWHALYALIAVAGAIVVGSIKLGMAVAPYIGPLGTPIAAGLDRLLDGVHYVLNHRYTEMVFKAVLLISIIGSIGGSLVIIGFFLYTQFLTTLMYAGGIIFGLGAGFGILLLVEYISDLAKNAANGVAAKANAAGQKAVQTPGVRRVYGECPVSMDAAPKWFDNLFSDEDEL